MKDFRNCVEGYYAWLLAFLLIIQSSISFSEGTRELTPTSSDYGFLQIFDNNTTTRPFMTYGANANYRLHIRICNVGEKIFMGFKQTNNDVFFRLRDPNGNLVPVPGLTASGAANTYRVPTSGAGYINTYNQAVNGPTGATGVTGGYTPVVVTSTMTGDYYIEFNPTSATVINAVKRVFDLFDITVTRANNAIVRGRLWSKQWDVQCNAQSNPFKGSMFIYADDGVVTRINFNGAQPFGFTIFANNFGVDSTGNIAADRQSKSGNVNRPKYKIFLNDPDNACFPTGAFGQLTQPTTITGCPPNYCINIFGDRVGHADVLLDLNGVNGYQANTRDRILGIDIVPGANCIPWDGRDGQGNLVTTSISVTTKTSFYNGLTHLPLFDVENNPNGWIVSLVRPTGAIPKLYWDDTGVGSTANLNGCTNASGCHSWPTNFGDNKTMNTWWYADSTGSVSSNIVPPAIVVRADTRPTGGAGGKKDTTICKSVASYGLNAQILNSSGGTWTTTGTGTFSPNATTLNGSYNITAADRTAGMIRLILTAAGNSNCPAISDTLTIRFQNEPSTNAGGPVTVCANNPAVTLNGSFTNATGAVWSTSGTGSFNSTTSMTATYTPSAADISSGSVTLTLSSSGNGKCSSGISTKLITIQAAPIVSAGTPQTACFNNPAITLAGSVTNATSQTWSGGAGSFSPNANALNAVYTPTAAERTAGTVTLTLTASRAGCNNVTSNVTMNIQAAPTANAGANQSVCFNNANVTLNGAVTNATSFNWVAGGGTFTPNNTTLNTVYTPTAAERAAGNFTITLNANRAGCTTVSSTMTVTVTPSPIVNAGLDGSVCANRPTYTLSGTSTTGSGAWLGLGTFFPNANTLNATYTPDPSEIAMGVAALVLRSENNNNCNGVSDTMLLIITPSPTVNAGIDRSACKNNASITLAGTTTGASSVVWSGGTGTFTPNTTTAGAVYQPSPAELSAGSVTLTLTASRATCNAVTDNMVITYTPEPTINAGADQSICFNNPAVSLNGNVTVASGGTWSGGAGTFSPSNALTTTYTPTAAELSSGTINLTLTSTGNNGCNAVADQMVITITPAPTVNAGTPQSVCGNNPQVTLNGAVTIATAGTWSGGAGTFTPNANTLNASYVPTSAEVNAGSVNLTLTSTNNGNCNAVTGNVTITYTASPTVNAGADQTICGDNPVAVLNGSRTVASGGSWSGGAGTFSPNNATLNASYNATAAEIAAGTVTLTLTTTGNTSNCTSVSDQVVLTIRPIPMVNAGPDQTICAAASNVALSGIVTDAPGVQWTTAGTGTFSPNATTLNATYVPSAADKTTGNVTLTLSTTGMAPCLVKQDQMVIYFTGVPSINAGPDQIICTNNFPIHLTGSGSPARWSGGTGTFSNINILNPTYTPSAAEVTAGTVTLTLTTNASGACPTVNDQVTISLPPAPVANAGTDRTMCGNASGFALNGSVSNAVGGFWSTSGTGSFSNVNDLNATYQPSVLDKTNGTVTITLSTTGNGPCSGSSDDMILTIQPAIIVDAGPNQSVCADQNGFTLSGANVTNATGGTWTSSGTGTFTPSANTVSVSYNPSAADKTAGTVTLTLTSTGNGICPAVTDNVVYTINPAPTVNAGTDQTICADAANVTLNGSFTIATGIQWSTSGTGTFTPNSSTQNATYTPSAADKASGTVTLTAATTGNGNCNPVTDQMVITITPIPTVNAGTDKSVCGDVGAVSVTGTVTIATGGTWITSGDGSFSNPNTLTTSYTLGPNDIINGFTTLTLTSTGNGLCNPVSDQMVISIAPIPTVDAGADRNVCKNNPTVTLLGTVTVAGGGIWTGGAGTFNPGATDLNPTYTATAAEITAGTLTLTLETTGNGLCNAKSDQIVITFTDSPTVNAGSDHTICADSSGVTLNGSYGVASGIQWTTSGTGSFFPSSVAPGATYVPSIADRTAGNVTLTLTTTGNGNCNETSDQTEITITPAPTVNAGADQTVCANNAVVSLSGTKTIASGVIWTSTGTGTFADASSLTTTYTPSTLDNSAGSVKLTLTTTGNGTCTSVYDELIITITPAPTVNAGADQSVCANNPDVNLNGLFTVASGAAWTTSGSGTFAPDAQTMNAVYTPSSADISSGSVTFTLTTTGNGLCDAVSDQMVVSITAAPTVNAGTDQTVCANTAGVNLSGARTIANGSLWTSSGTGSFSPNATVLNATYVPSAADTTAKSVTLTLTTTGNGNCTAVHDEMIISFNSVPVVNAGSDQLLCGDVEYAQLEGIVVNATGGNWTTSGTGTFGPNSSFLNATYNPSPSERNGGTYTLTLTSTGNGVCQPVSDQMTITFTPAPNALAGPDQTVCANNAAVTLNGSVINAGGGTWLTSGDGTFADVDALSTTYTPSADDIANGNVTLTLQTTGNGACSFVRSSLFITITPAPTVDAGIAQSVCANNATVTLSGAVTVATGGTWTSSGTGAFTNANSVTTTYVPSAADKTAGTVTLTLTSTGNASCSPVNDQMVITITPAPTVNAGVDQTVCANNAVTTLNGTVTVATGGTWTSSGTGTFADANSLATSYTPSASDITGGSVTLTLTTTNNANCIAVSDQMVIFVTPAPTVNAGADQTVCANNATVTLGGSVTVVTNGTWTSNGSGSFGNANLLGTTYTPSAADITAGTVTLTLTTTGNGNCSAVADQMVITITPAPTVDAGTDQSVCANNPKVSLNGTVTVATGGTWTSSGTGLFSNTNGLVTDYTPSAADITAGSVTLTLTTAGNGSCIQVADQMVVTITPAPVVNPGSPVTVCANTTGVVLNGIVTNATGGTWSTASGTGTFSPDANTLNATFVPSSLHIANGRANLTLTSTGNGNCLAVSATVVITIQPLPVVNAGPDVQVCTGTPTIALSGSMTNAGGVAWTTSGTGTFTPNANALNAIYNPSVADNVDGNTVTLTLSSTGNGSCSVVADDMTITFQTVPVNAGPDQTVCGNTLPVQLNGSGNGTWSGGTGTFSDPTSLSTTYTPSAAEIPGTVTLTLTGVAVGSCVPGTDDVIITIIEGPTANAGSNQSICANNGVINLNGSVTNATGGTWKTEGSGTFGNINNTATSYTASAADVADGTIILTLITTGNGICNADSSKITVTYTPAPVVDAGVDQASCANAGPISLNGTVTVVSGATWSIVSGAGTIASPGSLSTTYTPAPADITAGLVRLRLTSDADPVNLCNPVSDDIVISFGAAPTVDAGTDQGICRNNGKVTLNGSVTTATGGVWTTSGGGTFAPNANSLNATYTASPADTALASVTLTLTTTGNGNCIAVNDQVIISFTPSPSANAGVDQSICSNNSTVSLNGAVSNATGGSWTSSGTGVFGNNTQLNTTYVPSASDIAAGTITLTMTTTGIGTCNSVSDQLVINFTPPPTADAGIDQASCANAGPVNLNGIVSVATTGTWSIVSGAGTIAAPGSLSTTYTPAAADITAGSVTLRLTTDPTGNCSDVSDDIVISFGAAPTVSAGTDQIICADAASVSLGGSVTVAGGARWTSSGSGIFTPDAFNLNASYIPSAADTTAHSVTLTLTSVDNGNCMAVADQMTITFTPIPRVDAGANQTVCKDITAVSLSGNVAIATGGAWTSTGTGTFTNANSINTNYTPSVADKDAGSVVFTLRSTGNGTCNTYSDYMTVLFTPIPTANAGLDQSQCVDAVSFNLNGSVTIATAGLWSTAGTGIFGDVNSLSTTYTPSAADKTAGSVTLTLTSQNNGTCNPVTDQVVLSFTSAPAINAGIDRVICSDKDSIHLAGSFTVASGVDWTSSGTGVFSPSASQPGTIYYPSVADLTGTTLTLTMTTTGNGTCNPVSDQVAITINPIAIVDAGTDISICAGQSMVLLNGTVTNATGGIWTTNGTGSFASNDNTMQSPTTYIPSDEDLKNGGLIFTLTSTGGLCSPVSDVVGVTIKPTPAAVVNAGFDQLVCSNENVIKLAGFIKNADGGLWSVTGGAGGAFSDTTMHSPTGIYTATYTAASTASNITVRLATLPDQTCSSVYDDMLISFAAAPVIEAGPNQTICGDLAGVVNLNGSVTNATGGVWTALGTGVFAPDAMINTPTYYPSPRDKSTNSIKLYYTSTGNGVCKPTKDSIIVTIRRPPTINAGADQIVCASTTSISLNAAVTSSTGGAWTTSGVGTFGNANALTTVYSPAPGDTTVKVVNLIVTSTGNGTCTPVSDNLKITFVPVPLVGAGVDRTVCASASSVDLSGYVANATGGAWTTSGSGNFDNPFVIHSRYMPSAADVSNGSVTLTLQTTGTTLCAPVNDQVVITLQPIPMVDAGTAMICEVEFGSPLGGDVVNAGGGIWSTSGSGVFAPNKSDLFATYFPSPADVSAGKVTLTLTTTGNGECAAVTESTTLSIDPMPFANAGPDKFICPGSSTILSAQTSPGVNYGWYILGGANIGTSADVSVTGVSRTAYVLAATNAKGCAATDTVIVDIFTMPNLILDANYCISNSLIVNGIPTPEPNVPGTYYWIHDGQLVLNNYTPIISPTEPGDYELIFSFENCASSASTSVNPIPRLVGGFIKDCIGKTTDLTVKANGGGYTYNWSTGQSGTDLNTINVPVVADTTYYIATVTNPVTSCSTKDSVRIIGIPTPVLNLTDISSCEGMSHLLDGRPANIANLDSLYPEYAWFRNNNPLAENVDHITVTTTGLYKEILTIGQCVVKDSGQVDFHVNPVLTLSDYVKFCKPTENKTIITVGASGTSNTYIWTAPAGATMDSINTQSVTVRYEGMYHVVVTNEFNCSTGDSIFVDDLCGPRTDGPNAIIPGDPNNGVFRIYGDYFKNYKLTIFNRWGEVVFMSTDQMVGWDGTYLGEPMPIGTYPYVVTYDSEDPELKGNHKKEGSITIIR